MTADDTPKGTQKGTDRGTIMLIALVVLAVLASIIMLFSHSDVAMKVAVLAALWAAFLGLFLVARYRKVADDERAHSELQRLKFESELRHEQEEFKNKQLGAVSSQDTELLQEIKGQLAELREQLEELSGRQFGYEPAALLAEARRIEEIEAVAEDVEKQAPEAPRRSPLADETAVLTPVAPRGKDRFGTGSFAAVKLDAEVSQPRKKVEAPQAPVTPAPEPEAKSASHGRRRRDERTDGVSVAELLANLKKNK